jgi:Zn-dependent peptidase ImmA (M78 family)
MSKTKKLLDIAKRKGVKVSFRSRINYLGVYDYNDDLIKIKKDVPSKREILYILAHEIGHAHYKHGRYYKNTDTEAFEYIFDNEIEAWNYASRLAKRIGFHNKCFVKFRNDCLLISYRVLKKVWRIHD